MKHVLPVYLFKGQDDVSEDRSKLAISDLAASVKVLRQRSLWSGVLLYILYVLHHEIDVVLLLKVVKQVGNMPRRRKH